MTEKTPVSPSPSAAPQPLASTATQKSSAAKAVNSTLVADVSGETIRVQVNLLDSLMNLVGELVLIRNQVVQYTLAKEEPELVNLSQRLNIVTSELQNEVMKTRMQPIGNILSKFQRIVRDISRELGKEVELKLEGTETELDKTLIEAVKDPLTHIVRNSVDHGIETPEERRESGKTSDGQLLIRSFHEGGQVVIEVVDDGRGLSRQKIGTKAVEKGLITAEGLDRMSDREVNNLIFLPGFSTAEKVSNFSGRGVGMDVVRTNIEKIGGVVDVSSTEGLGMSIRLKIPLTLAIVPALIVRCSGDAFAIPQVKLVELVRVEGNGSGTASSIQMLQGQPVFRLRGDLLSLVSLNALLHLEALGKPVTAQKIGDDEGPEAVNIAVLNSDSGQFGLIVDTIEDSTDIVVKPLSNGLKNIGVYSGATVLGDGTVALVLDVNGLAARGHIFDEKVAETTAQTPGEASEEKLVNLAEYLVLALGVSGRYAIPLCLVTRLEEFRLSTVERAGDQRVVRYRGSILPIISIRQHLALDVVSASSPASAPADHEMDALKTIAVVVVERGGRPYGLEVESIIDIIAIDSPIDTHGKGRKSIFGTTQHSDGVIVVIDVLKLIDEVNVANGDVSDEVVIANGSENKRQKHHVLVVEDNGFFRKQIQQILIDAGYRVTVDVNGEDAFKRLLRMGDEEFSLLLSDIEMPRVTGLQLAKKVRSTERYNRLPLIAMTARTCTEDREAGFAAGFNKYLAKLDAAQLVLELDESLGLVKGVRHGT